MKQYIQPEELRHDSFVLGAKVIEDGYKPDFMVALWRGGSTIGIFCHELLKRRGIKVDHICIRTSRYTGIDTTEEKVKVFNLNYIVKNIVNGSKILLVDDVFDTGRTIEAFLSKLAEKVKERNGEEDINYEVRIATVYYKPTRNQTQIVPNYFVHESASWLVYPHEISDMDDQELEEFLGKATSDVIKRTC